ncbi:hypothetical protein MKK88_17675 [Methylobacterium sp. E-005]|uniref:hypothetical protein n=1 Tax=Methylobacterium sp. E-005 TaxID=2836549 RepID=UPI001FBC016B|nr:hypothetical protein [Methylobacterium sp. E-005]MCJ2087796.1 hypothetical protein [Methylobacterium sp. E-005]
MAKPTQGKMRPPQRASLRERAADVEASAARVLRRLSKGQEAAEPTASACAAELRDHWLAAVEAVNQRGLTDEAADRLGTIATAAEQAVIDAPVHSIGDLACKVDVLRMSFEVNSLDSGLAYAAVRAICDGIDTLAAAEASEQADPILPAIAAHRTAFVAANSQLTDELSELACQHADQAYGALAATTPTTTAGLCALAAHLQEFLRDSGIEIGNTFQEEALTILLDTANRFARQQGSPVALKAGGAAEWAMTQAYAVDLSNLDILALSNLWDAYTSVRDQWQAVSELAYCIDYRQAGSHRHTPAGALADAEGERAAFIRDRIADEMRLRNPQADWERDTALSLRIKDELLCEGAIRNRDLLLEAVKAWG